MFSAAGGSRVADDGRLSARGRILDVAYRLFSVNGVQAVGIDRIVAESEVAKMTLYRYFPSKDDLVLAFLEERTRRWTHEWLQASVERTAPTPGDRLLTVFDVLDLWFHDPQYEGCSFIRTLHEIREGPLHDATVHHLELIREIIATYAAEAGAPNPETLSYQAQILMMGAMVSALRGDVGAARRTRDVVVLLLDAPH